MNGLTLKQRIFLKEYLECGNGTKAAMIAYDTKDANTAGMIASENLRKPKIVDSLKSILDKAGLSEDMIAKRLKKVIMNPEPLDGVSVAAMNAVARFKGYDTPRREFESPRCPLPDGEWDDLIKKAKRATNQLTTSP